MVSTGVLQDPVGLFITIAAVSLGALFDQPSKAVSSSQFSSRLDGTLHSVAGPASFESARNS